MTEDTGSLWKALCGDTTARDRRNLARFAAITAGWAVTFVGGAALLRRELVPEGPLAWGLAGLPAVLSVFVVLAYARFLREADELQRSIHLGALALGFGGGWLAVAGYRLFELLGAPYVDRGSVAVVMAVTYTLGLVAGRVRYR